MISVMIVDDEYWVRVGIKKQAKWEELGVESIYEAKNGQEALSEALSKKPDIIITDMRMPVMDGVELLRRVNKELPLSKMIIISGYSDFKYMQEAIKCGAFSYLLKPIKEKELNETLNDAISKIVNEREEVEKRRKLVLLNSKYAFNLKDKLLNEFINNEISFSEVLSYNIHEINSKFGSDKNEVVITGIVNISTALTNDPAIKTVIEETIQNESNCLCFKKNKKEYILISGFDRCESNGQIEDRFEKMCLKLCDILEQKNSVKVKILIGNLTDGIDGIIKSYKEMTLLKNNINLMGREKLLFARNLPNVKSHKDLECIEEFKLLEQHVKDCQKSGSVEVINDMFNKLVQLGSISFNDIKNLVLKFDEIIDNILREFNSNLQSIDHKSDLCMDDVIISSDLNYLKEYFLNNCINTIDVIISKRDEEAKKLIRQIVDYMNSNYGEEIKLSALSQKYYFNIEYISRIFKREVGINFSDYLKEIRMKKALEFLKKENLKIVDIACMLGYNDEHYFSKVFKEYYSYTPSQYRKLL